MSGRSLRRAEQRRQTAAAAKDRDASTVVLAHLNVESSAEGRIDLLLQFFEDAGVLSAHNVRLLRTLARGLPWKPDAGADAVAATVYRYLRFFLVLARNWPAVAVVDYFVSPLIDESKAIRRPRPSEGDERACEKLDNIWRVATLARRRLGTRGPRLSIKDVLRNLLSQRASAAAAWFGMHRLDDWRPDPLASRPFMATITANAPPQPSLGAVPAAGPVALTCA